MTIEGAIAELQNLIKADDVPFYYDGVIRKVIETIIDERPVRCGECNHSGTDGKNTFCMWLGALRKPTDFCSYGERRADDSD